MLKENIDGEALEWANKRLGFKEQKRKILIVISDGAPVDDSTLSANNANILEFLSQNVQHLQYISFHYHCAAMISYVLFCFCF